MEERLDYDKDNLKETSDIYVKPRLIVVALTGVSTIFGCMFLFKIRSFIKKLCPGNKANIGGTYRRNLFVLSETAVLFAGYSCFYLWESVLIFLLYPTQDKIGIKIFLS
ncbi:uncharacterized protein LOC111718431 [Eurytemora carolleeae]|uniref:uncharacterized protein LOC111718431 n=1 Tax=Eurytemora carolleeae TaxID=1294199 RepID=UPI000C76DD94|nr:uncharacterized protein LOC111718431 [Eurytemora carolleeae]|eukprot:XP_023349782.1 uncharacterized protein LOC111718431 [Eurytemora affinis]